MMHEHDDFDIFLRKKLQQEKPYIDDGNFTAQTMARLPANKKLTRGQERLILVIPCVLITLFVLSQFPVLALTMKAWTLLMFLGWTGWMHLSLAIFVACVSVFAYWLLFVDDTA